MIVVIPLGNHCPRGSMMGPRGSEIVCKFHLMMKASGSQGDQFPNKSYGVRAWRISGGCKESVTT